MKKMIIVFCLLAGTATANAQTAAGSGTGRFSFSEETHDYGEVPEGPVAGYDFKFVNTGNGPIVITEAHGSCGCTVANWPKAPIMPGETSAIHVNYTTSGHAGIIQKDVFIASNAEQPNMVLHIKGTVQPKAADNAAASAVSNGNQ